MKQADHPISKFRQERGLTLEAFGTLVGVGKPTVSKWEAGHGPSPHMAVEIESKTGISKAALRPDLWSDSKSGEAAA